MVYLLSVLILFIIICLGAWRVFVAIHAFFPALSPAVYSVAYLLLCTALPIGFFLPHSKVTKLLSRIGTYWFCFQLTFFFSALVEWAIKLLLVNLLKILSAHQFAAISLILFAITALLTIYGILHARNVQITHYNCTTEKSYPDHTLAEKPHSDHALTEKPHPDHALTEKPHPDHALTEKPHPDHAPTEKPYSDHALTEKPHSGQALRIIHLSDIHLGSINDLNAMRKIVQKCNALNPDLVCITGDTFTETVRDVFELEEIADEFRSLNSRYGVYACLGNHDSGDEFDPMMDFFKKANIHVLVDQFIEFEGISLLGRSDMTPGGNLEHHRMPIQECLEGVNPNHYLIVMDHQPGDIESTSTAGADMLLCGHTHGGQFFPVHRMIRRVFPLYYGYKKHGGMDVIVSSGTCAAVPPIRVGSRSEIVCITVEQK